MKYLKIIALLLLVISCQKKHYADYYMAYDMVAIHQEPFDDSPVVGSVSSLKAPGNFRYNKAKPVFYNANVRGVARPLAILEMDQSGEWGLIQVTDFNHNCKGWVRLDQMAFAGNYNPQNITAAYVVKGRKVSLYKKPKAGTPLNYWLLQGDTVRLWATNNGWGHVSSFKVHRSADDETRIGWVQLSQLTPIDSLSYSGVVKARKDVAREKKTSNIGLDRPIFGGGVLLSLIMALLLSWTAGKRRKRKELWISMAFCAVVLAAQAYFTGVSTSNPGLTVLSTVASGCLAFVLLYPLIYVRFIARLWKYIFIVLGGYFALMPLFGIHNPVMVAALAAGAIAIIVLIARGMHKDVCPHCGCYGAHRKGAITSQRGETSRENWRETTTKGGYTVSRREYQVIKGWSRYTTERWCLRCGEYYENREFWTTETRRG